MSGSIHAECLPETCINFSSFIEFTSDQQLKFILDHGFLLFRDVSVSKEELLFRLKNIGPFYNDSNPLLHVQASDNSPTLAFTTAALEPHNECFYDEVAPLIIVIYCLNGGTEGGTFFLIDSDEVISRIGDMYLNALFETEFNIISPRTNLTHCRKLVVPHLIYKDKVVIRYSAIGTRTNSVSNIKIKEEKHPLSSLILNRLNIVLSKSNIYQKHSWRKGDLLLLDNYSYLHGRTGFKGNGRHLLHVRLAVPSIVENKCSNLTDI